jgi:hypothetical protein
MSQSDYSEIEKKTIKSSLAIFLVDDFSAGPPKGRIDVVIRDLNKKAVKSFGNCFSFFDLPSQQEYSVQVRSENYFNLEFSSKPLEHGEMPPAYYLIPLPSYSFPRGETLVRGILRDSKGIEICNVTLSSRVEALSFIGRADSRGEFSVYFKSLKRENLSRDGLYIVSGKDNNKNNKILTFKLNYSDRERSSNGPVSGFFKDIKAGIINSKGNGATIEVDNLKGGS